MENKYLTVSALNKYLYYKFDIDMNLKNVFLKGEISNIRFSKGIMYFVLKDEESEIDGLMFENTYKKIGTDIKDGTSVLVSGKVGLYLKRGTYAITVYSMEEVGLGKAYLDFMNLKEKLAIEGLFKDEQKKAIPEYCENIGVVTSSTGDALHDVISTVNRRFPLAHIYIYPCIVQGSAAPESIIKAIIKANSDKLVDVLIICRGGGTFEDLSCFNDEKLARTIFNSAIPTISGVGHEQDFTICDFVSSRRAPTPTGAAMVATKDVNNIFITLSDINKKLKNSLINKVTQCYNEYKLLQNELSTATIEKKFNDYFQTVDTLQNLITAYSPIRTIKTFSEKNDNLVIQLKKNFNLLIENYENQVMKKIDKLILLNPLNVLSKGYSLVLSENNNIISTKKELKEKEIVRIKFYDGTVKAQIIDEE